MPPPHASSSRSSHGVASSSSPHASRSGKSLHQLNAGVELSAAALLAASAQASDDLERILRGEEAAQHRRRSRSRSQSKERATTQHEHRREKKTHKAALLDATSDDPFLVHHAAAATASHHSSTSTADAKRRKKSRERERERDRASSKHRSSSSSLLQKLDATSSKHRASREKKHRSRHRSASRSLERTREREPEYTRSSPSSHAHHPRHSSSSAHRQPHRSRSRSHSRNRYPDGLAPPLQAVGGGIDHELRSKFIDPFEHHHAHGYDERDPRYTHQRSPPMSPSRLDARARYEYEQRLIDSEMRERDSRRREELFQRSHHSSSLDPYLGSTDARRYDNSMPRREYGFTGGPLGTGNDLDAENARNFDLETDMDDPSRAEPMSADMTWAGKSNVLMCGLCESRYEDPSAGNAGKVPRYMLCGHTWCTACLNKAYETQADLALATDSGTAAPGALVPMTQAFSLHSHINLPCPSGTCAPTPLNEHGVLALPVNTSYLAVGQFLRARRAAGHGLKDTGIGRGDERSEEDRLKELNAELEEDARVQTGIASSYGLAPSLPCQQCSVHLANVFCQACNICFCSACSASTHVGRALATHLKRGLVLPLNVARARGLLFPGGGGGGTALGANGSTATGGGGPGSAVPGLVCPTHSDQQLSLYCRTCQIPVCRDCVTPLFHGKHLAPGHDVDLLSTVLESTQSELKLSLHSIESVITRLERTGVQEAGAIDAVGKRITEVQTELKDAFGLIRASFLKALAEREQKLQKELLAKAHVKEARIQARRAEIAKSLVGSRAAYEAAVRVLQSGAGEEKSDIFAIKALLDVRAAINSASSQLTAFTTTTTTGGDAHHQQDVLLRVKPRELIRLLEVQIAKQGGVIASIPSEPVFTSFAASGTSLVLSWAPNGASGPPVEGEVLEYLLEVCEIPRTWRAHLRRLQPTLFATPPVDDEDAEEESKWDGQGVLGDRQKAAVNWLSLAPGPVNIAAGGGEAIWKAAGGAGWAGAFTTLYSGEVLSVKHDHLNLHSAYIYRLSVKNDLGASAYTYSTPMTLPTMHLSYTSDMDSSGLITYLGSQGGMSQWTNPVTAQLIEVSASSIQLGEASSLTSRQAGTFQTLNRHLSWIRFDLGKAQPFRLCLTHYTLANCGRGVGVRRVLRNWALQGSQNGVDWVTLREHVKDSTLAAIPLATATWTVTQPTPEPYRYVRLLQTDVNQANDHHLALGQIELYGWLVRD